MSIEETDALLLNTRAFLSFQITQTEVNQIILKNMCGSRQSRHVSELDKVLMKVA